MLLLLPLIVGVCAGGRLSVEVLYLLVASLAVFFMRQPLLALAKVRSGRRPATDMPAACVWLLLYATIAGLHLYGLVLRGHVDVLLLGVPAAPIAAWHAWLVMKRSERRQELMEILAAGALALSAPAALVIARGGWEAEGWWLWGLTWAATASLIACTYLALTGRTQDAPPGARRRASVVALLIPTLGLMAAIGGGALDVLSPWMLVPFVILILEALRTSLRPGVGTRPRTIGLRQLAISVLVTSAFVVATWAP